LREFSNSAPDPSQPEVPSKFIDVSGSGFVEPIDALLVVARLRRDLNA
jgi:hypothetical protein